MNLKVFIVTQQGGCHCGAVRFRIDVPERVELLDCNCSICAKTGYLHLIVAHAAFERLDTAGALTSYRFGSGAAEHLFCSRCGIKSYYQPRSHPGAWSVNWRCLDSTDGVTADVRPFDGRDWENARAAL